MKKLLYTILTTAILSGLLSLGYLSVSLREVGDVKCDAKKAALIKESQALMAQSEEVVKKVKGDFISTCEQVTNDALCQAFTSSSVEISVPCKAGSFVLKRK